MMHQHDAQVHKGADLPASSHHHQNKNRKSKLTCSTGSGIKPPTSLTHAAGRLSWNFNQISDSASSGMGGLGESRS